MNRIFEIEGLNGLEVFLESQDDIGKLRDSLFAEFLKYAGYKNVEEQNNAVRVCKSLAIMDWGSNGVPEALRGSLFNGDPMTRFIGKHREPRFVEAIWSRRIDRFTMEARRTSHHFSPGDPFQRQSIVWEYKTKGDAQGMELRSQQNWIPRNPIQIEHVVGNCYESSEVVIESIENDLQSELSKQMRPELYGQAVNKAILECSFSCYGHVCCKYDYTIADEKLKLRQKELYPKLLAILTKREIEENGYYLRNRFGFGPLRTDTGKVEAVIALEREFSELSHSEQKKRLSECILLALSHITNKLNKKVKYDSDLVLANFSVILTKWSNEQLSLTSK